MFKPLLIARSPLSCIDLEKIAKTSGFIQRNTRSFSAFGILCALLKCAIIGKGSFSQIASHLKSFEEAALSRQAVWQRIGKTCVKYLSNVAQDLIAHHSIPASAVCKKWGIKRILTEDSTFQKMHRSNAGNFPGHGNQLGTTSGFKIDFIYDLLTGKPLCQKLYGGTQQDKVLGKRILDFVKKSDLVLRDMGYFSLDLFEAIQLKSANWLTRLPVNVGVTTLNGDPIEKQLRSRKNTRLDMIVLVGEKRLKCRLVAVRADDDLAAKRRRNRKKQSKKTPSQQSIIKDGWHILITCLDESHEPKELFEIYRLRWNIEVRFKAWKQAIDMDSLYCRRSNLCHQESLIYAALIFQLINLNVAANLDLRGRALSLENFAKEIAKLILGLSAAVPELKFQFDPRHVLMESRKRKPQTVKLLMDQLFTH